MEENKRYTFSDYLAWPENERIELIDGIPVKIAPPCRAHQAASLSLAAQLYYFLDGKPCKVYAAPFAVRLFEKATDAPEDVDTVVEPDISVICDPDKLDVHGCKGTPDLVIEILSPSTQRHDRVTKFNLYQRAGVKEYWMVNIEDKTIQVFVLAEGILRPIESYGKDELAKSRVLAGCEINLTKVFTK